MLAWLLDRETRDGHLSVTAVGGSGPDEFSQHGVGAMRTYSLGAILLDLNDPRRVLACSDGPILTPTAGRRDGYVPNVVYTCGACAHDDTLILPYGIGDQSISIGRLSIKALLAALRPV